MAMQVQRAIAGHTLRDCRDSTGNFGNFLRLFSSFLHGFYEKSGAKASFIKAAKAIRKKDFKTRESTVYFGSFPPFIPHIWETAKSHKRRN